MWNHFSNFNSVSNFAPQQYIFDFDNQGTANLTHQQNQKSLLNLGVSATFNLDKDTVILNRITDSYAYAFNGGPPSAIRNAVIKSTAPIGNRGVFVEKLPLNRGTKDRFQSRLVVNRPNYNYYSSGFLERARLLERERIRAGLAHVEILMNNPNEYGYVMLDDRALNVLASLIDKILTKDINLH